MARCPIHQELLQTYSTTLTKMGKSFDCIAGKCRWCTRIYLNIPFFHHYDEVEIQGTQYIYHAQLAREFPAPENNTQIVPNAKNTPPYSKETPQKVINPKKAKKKTQPAKQKKSKQTSPVSMQSSTKHKQVQSGNLKEEKVFREKYLHVINNPQLPHYFRSVKYVESIPKYCDIDRYELVKINQAVFDTFGMRVRTRGMCCIRCSTVYLHHSKKDRIAEEARLKNKLPRSNTEKKKNFSWNKTLLQIPVMDTNESRCPFCKHEFSGMSNIKYRCGENTERYTLARSCRSCELVILDRTQIQQIQCQLGNEKIYTIKPNAYKSAAEIMADTQKMPIAKSKNTIQLLPYEQELAMPLNLSEAGKKITIFAQKCHCSNCYQKYSRHTIFSRTAKVLSSSGQWVDVNVMFCAGCGHYYMAYESFKQYKKAYGRLLFECELSSELQNGNGSFLDFAPDSLLSRWGYNVKKDMPIEHRQAILQFLLETRRITKFEAVEMIKGFIQLKDRQPRFCDACERWREDIFFINNYRIKGQDVVYGLTFKQGGKITR